MPTITAPQKTEKHSTAPAKTTELELPPHPAAQGFAALRPILVGVGLFLALNLLFTAGVTVSKLNGNFNFKYGNFLPAKLALLDSRTASDKPNVLFLGTSQTNHGFIPKVFEESFVTASDDKFNSAKTGDQFPPPLRGRARVGGKPSQNPANTGSTGGSRLSSPPTLTLPLEGEGDRSPVSAKRVEPVRLKSFNLGLPNNRYDIMQGVLQSHVARYGKPKLVLLELGPSLQELDGSFYYLPALYYRTLLERSITNSPSLVAQWLQNPQMAEPVRRELLTSVTSTLRQFRYTFSPMNILSKVVDAVQGKVASPLQAKLTPVLSKLPVTVTDVVASAGPSSEEEEPANGAAMVDPPASTITASTLEAWSQGGWYAKDPSPNMATSSGVEKSIEAARQYYIAPQKAIHFDKLRSLLAYCQQQGIPVVLVSWPNHPGMNKAFRDSRLSRDYGQGVAEVLRDFPKAPLIDFNGLSGKDAGKDPDNNEAKAESQLAETARQHQFADPRHLTPEGAAVYSRLLGEKLALLTAH